MCNSPYATLEKWTGIYNDACRVLALAAMDYQNHIGTSQERFLHGCLIASIDEVRALNIYKNETFGLPPSLYAVPA